MARPIQQRAFNIADLRELARRRLPRGLFAYVERGAEDDVSLAANRAALRRWQLVPRVGVDVSEVDLGCHWFGQSQPLPFAIGPTALSALLWHGGEIALARAAAVAGVPYTVGTYSLTAMEALFDILGERLWFQLYLLRDRALTWQLVERARSAGITTLLVTLDIPVEPNREYARRTGFCLPFRFTPTNLADVLTHPRWLAGVFLRYRLGGGLPVFANLPAAGDVTSAATVQRLAIDPTATWDTLAELRARWPHRLVVKGVLHPGDALRAVACGADGIVVSNHGGRALDGAVAPLDVLPAISAAVGSRLTIFCDGGIRRGSDIVKALALGAHGVLLGRAALYGVAAAGETGAAHALSLLREETARTLALLGCSRQGALTADQLRADTNSSS